MIRANIWRTVNELTLRELLFLLFVNMLLMGCDFLKPPEPAKKPPWGKWLPPDAAHPEKRLQVKFGDVLYEIPVSYLSGKGSAQKVDDYAYMHAYIIASYPDLVPIHKMHKQHIPQYPRVEVILGGHKYDPVTIHLNATINKDAQNKNAPFHSDLPWGLRLHKCGEAFPSPLAKDMYQYTCNFKNGQLYFTPIDTSIRTTIGYKLFIGCFDSLLQVKYQCEIDSQLFNDGRYLTTRLYINDLSILLDVYYKTLQLVSSLEAHNQQGE